MALISKLKLESLREPATVLFKEYKKKLGDEKRDDIGPKELSFTLLYMAMLTQKKKVMDIDTMLEKCSLKKRN